MVFKTWPQQKGSIVDKTPPQTLSEAHSLLYFQTKYSWPSLWMEVSLLISFEAYFLLSLFY